MNVSHSNYNGSPQFGGFIRDTYAKLRRRKTSEIIEPTLNKSTVTQNRDRIELNTNTAEFRANVDAKANAIRPALNTFESIDPSQSAINGADVIKTLVMATNDMDKKYKAAMNDYEMSQNKLNFNKVLGSTKLFKLKEKLTGNTPKEPVNPEGWIKLSWLQDNYHPSQADTLEKVLDVLQNNNVTNFRVMGSGDDRYGEIRLTEYVTDAVDQIIKEQRR